MIKISGGHFDYGCYKITQFAEDLQHDIQTNKDILPESWGEARNLNDATIAKLKEYQQQLEFLGRVAREIEWLYSGDHGEDSFMRILKNLEDENDEPG